MNYIAGSVRRQHEANPGPILPFGIALFDLEQEKKVFNFWTVLVMKSPKAAENSQV